MAARNQPITKRPAARKPTGGVAAKWAEKADAEPAQALVETMQRRLLEEFAPASVLINERFQVLCFQGPTIRYLEFPSGDATHDLLSLARPGLHTKLRGAIERAMEKGEAVIEETARVIDRGCDVACKITVMP